ncbi:MAG: 3-oxoacyl-ACP synthase [Bacteroidota bacterium]|nr:3-oxoacyl-ACP synthase [Bacteroidota bacterium]
MMDLSWKQQIYDESIKVISEKIAHAKSAMQAAQEAANTEEKSSMGDKYETGRAMSQLAKDMNAKQMVAFQNELNHLQKLSQLHPSKTVSSGALVQTEQGYFFIAAAIGSISINQVKIMVLSSETPLSQALWGKKAGDVYELNGKKSKILGIV